MSIKSIPNAASRFKTIYIAGPMTGYKDLNFPAFDKAADEFRLNGWTVLNPADHGVIDGATWEDYLRFDITKLIQCDSIYMLEGWQDSKGAQLEYLIAERLEMNILYQQRFVEVA